MSIWNVATIVELQVDEKTDGVYLRLDESKINESEEVSPGVVLDFNQQNQASKIKYSQLKIALIGICFVFSVSAYAQTWSQSDAPTNFWTSVALSADATKMVAVAGDSFNGVPSSIYISTNSGITWNKTSSASNRWTTVAGSADGIKLAAAAQSGFIFTSNDGGSTWISNSVPRLSWRSIASSADGSKLFVETVFGQFYKTTNFGSLWTSNSAPGGTWAIACSPDATKLIAGGGNSVPRSICISTNSGLTWTTNLNTPSSWVAWAVASSADGTKLWAVDGTGSPYGLIHRSMNAGATWETNNSPSGTWQSIAASADGTKVIAANWQGSGYPFGALYTSVDSGATWTSNNIPIQAWRGVACSPDGNTLVAVTDRGGPATSEIGKGRIWISHTISSPQLRSVLSNNAIDISWVIPSTDFLLQQNSDLNTTNWMNVTNTTMLNLTNLQNEVRLSLKTNNTYYRLRTP